MVETFDPSTGAVLLASDDLVAMRDKIDAEVRTAVVAHQGRTTPVVEG
jgi:hypothetical protein